MRDDRAFLLHIRDALRAGLIATPPRTGLHLGLLVDFPLSWEQVPGNECGRALACPQSPNPIPLERTRFYSYEP
jgi:hypothetical protein